MDSAARRERSVVEVEVEERVQVVGKARCRAAGERRVERELQVEDLGLEAGNDSDD